MEIRGRVLKERYLVKGKRSQSIFTLIYDATDQDTGTPVLVHLLKKEVTSSRREDITMYQEKMGVIKEFTHPHIMKVWDFGEEGGMLYYITEDVGFKSLKGIIEGGSIYDQKSIEIVSQVAVGLEYAHRYRICHLDLNPVNIVVVQTRGITQYGQIADIISPERRMSEDILIGVKIYNLGINSMIDYSKISDSSEFIEGMKYISPEQGRGEEGDERSDVYSLGVIFYELLGRQTPFDGNSGEEIMEKKMRGEIKKLREINEQVPPVLEEMVMKMLERDRDKRYQSVKGFLSDLEKLKSGDIEFKVGETQ